MHFLDLIMYFVTVVLLWFLIDKVTDGVGTHDISIPGHEIRTPGGIFIIIFYTLVYILIFAIAPDWNWVDFDFRFSVQKDFFKW